MRVRYGRARWPALVVLLALVAAACAGGDEEPAAAAGDATEPPPGSEDGPGDGEQPEEAAAGDGAAGAVEESEFSALLAEAEELRVAVTYAFEDERSGQTGRFVLGQDPPRTAMLFEQDGDPVGHMITDGEGIVNCAPEGGAWVCYRVAHMQGPAPLAAPMPMAPWLAQDPAWFVGQPWLRTSREQIAGRAALCAHVQGGMAAMATDSDATAQVCVDAELGIMLRTLIEGDGGSGRMEAVAVDTAPGADLFEPPAEPIDLGDFGPDSD